VLYRTNAQSRALENAFQLGGIQYQVVGGMRFYERREIKDVLAYLRVLVNPGDDVALRRILNVPARGIGKKTLEDLEAFAKATGISLLEAVRRAGAGSSDLGRGNIRAKLAELSALIERATARAPTVPVAEITKEILDEIGYREHLEKEHEREATTRWDNVEELLNAMQEFAETEERVETSAAAFLQEVSLTTDIDEYDEQAPRVTLMTLHNAKGLEFPWVFLTGLEEGLFPHSNSAYEKEGLEEERRLFYVGLTRAKERVTLFTATVRRRYGGMQHSMPSRFLDEIDPDLLERRAIVPEGRPARSMGTRFGSGEEWRGRTVRPSYDEGADDHPRYEEETQDAALATGMRVLHPSWGEGIIETLEGRGENLKLTIRFRGGVRKKVLAVYAKLELLG
jgi:DNA helicase-2/ATP-dependent DNA helicase PcrA